MHTYYSDSEPIQSCIMPRLDEWTRRVSYSPTSNLIVLTPHISNNANQLQTLFIPCLYTVCTGVYIKYSLLRLTVLIMKQADVFNVYGGT